MEVARKLYVENKKIIVLQFFATLNKAGNLNKGETLTF